MDSDKLKTKLLDMTQHSSLSPQEIQQQIASDIIIIDLAGLSQKANLTVITRVLLFSLTTEGNSSITIYKSLLIVHHLMLKIPKIVTSHFLSLRQCYKSPETRLSQKTTVVPR